MNWKKLVAAVIICEGVGILAGFSTASSVNTWYDTLNKPGFTPPNWLFAPVWTALYLLMGIAASLVWSLKLSTRGVKSALLFFLLQLISNGLWSFLFFGLKNPLAGLIDIVFLIVLLLITILKFRKLKPLSAYLLFPYLIWVLYATALNLEIVVLN